QLRAALPRRSGAARARWRGLAARGGCLPAGGGDHPRAGHDDRRVRGRDRADPGPSSPAGGSSWRLAGPDGTGGLEATHLSGSGLVVAPLPALLAELARSARARGGTPVVLGLSGLVLVVAPAFRLTPETHGA